MGSGPYVVTVGSRRSRRDARQSLLLAGKAADRTVDRAIVADANTAINLLRTHEIGGFFNDEDLGNYPILRAIAARTFRTTPSMPLARSSSIREIR